MRIGKVGVVGCGLMGSGIAQTAAEGGFTTIVREPTQELMDQGPGAYSRLPGERRGEGQDVACAPRRGVGDASRARRTCRIWRTATW